MADRSTSRKGILHNLDDLALHQIYVAQKVSTNHKKSIDYTVQTNIGHLLLAVALQ